MRACCCITDADASLPASPLLFSKLSSTEQASIPPELQNSVLHSNDLQPNACSLPFKPLVTCYRLSRAESSSVPQQESRGHPRALSLPSLPSPTSPPFQFSPVTAWLHALNSPQTENRVGLNTDFMYCSGTTVGSLPNELRLLLSLPLNCVILVIVSDRYFQNHNNVSSCQRLLTVIFRGKIFPYERDETSWKKQSGTEESKAKSKTFCIQNSKARRIFIMG